MITFYLVRHGIKVAIPYDPLLTDVGVKQAEATATLLKNITLKEIVSSPKKRAFQTAEIIAKPHSLLPHTDARLLERLEWESKKTFDEFIVEWSKTDIDRNYQPEDGMSSVKNGKQVKQLLDELAHTYQDGNILLVTHGGTIGDLLRNLFGEEEILHEIDPITHAPKIQIFECSVTVVEKKGDVYSLAKLNDTSHLSIPLT